MGVTDESGVSSISATLYDKSVPRERGFVFKADESDEGNIEQAIKWRMSKSIAESAAIPVQVVGWRTPDGELWAENMKGTITAPDVFILRETPVIIESVELTKDEGGDIAPYGCTAGIVYNHHAETAIRGRNAEMITTFSFITFLTIPTLKRLGRAEETVVSNGKGTPNVVPTASHTVLRRCITGGKKTRGVKIRIGNQ